MFPKRGVRISVSFWLLVVIAAIISPVQVVVNILLAAMLHECGHLAILRLFRVPVEGMRLTALGAELYARGAQRLSYGRELLVTLAGPAINLIVAVLAAAAALYMQWETLYVFAGANVILCLYNLLPILPLDGGRTLYLVTAYFFGPMVGDAVAAIVGTVCALSLLVLGIYLSIVSGSGMFFLLAAFSLLWGTLPQLRLAKIEIEKTLYYKGKLRIF